MHVILFHKLCNTFSDVDLVVVQNEGTESLDILILGFLSHPSFACGGELHLHTLNGSFC